MGKESTCNAGDTEDMGSIAGLGLQAIQEKKALSSEDGGVSGVSSSCGARGGFLPEKNHVVPTSWHWSGLPCPPSGNLPNPAIEPMSSVSPALQVDSLPTEPPGKPQPSPRTR